MSVGNGERLFTERLHLRPPVGADADAVIAICGDWEVARRLSRVPHPYGYSDFQFFLEQVVVAKPTWAIVLRATNALVGVVGLAPHQDGESAELGYYIASSQWGQGFATEAGQPIVSLGIEEFGYPRLTSGYHADNPASGRVLAKLGFKPTGVSTRLCLADGKDKPAIDVRTTGLIGKFKSFFLAALSVFGPSAAISAVGASSRPALDDIVTEFQSGDAWKQGRPVQGVRGRGRRKREWGGLQGSRRSPSVKGPRGGAVRAGSEFLEETQC